MVSTERWLATSLSRRCSRIFRSVSCTIRSGRHCTIDRQIASASGTRLADLLMLLCQHQPVFDDDPECRLRRLAEYFVYLGRCGLTEFASLAIGSAVSARAEQLVRVDAIVDGLGNYPPYWIAALRTYRNALASNLSKPDFVVPIEFERTGTTEDAFRDFQRFTGRFGKLLSAWPQLWIEARRINTGGPELPPWDRSIASRRRGVG